MNPPQAPSPKRNLARWAAWGALYVGLGVAGVHIGNDTPLATLVATDSYLSDVAFAIAMAVGVGLYVRAVAGRLAPWLRVGKMGLWLAYSALWAVGVPVAGVFVAEWLYITQGLGMALAESSMFYLELPLTGVFTALVYLLNVVPMLLRPVAAPALATDASEAPATVPLALPALLVKQGNTTRRVAPEDVASAWRVAGHCVLMLHTAEQLRTPHTLEELHQRLPHFFRLNRQVLVCRTAVAGYAPTPTRKLEVSLKPTAPLPDVFVSKANAPAFKEWLAGGSAGALS